MAYIRMGYFFTMSGIRVSSEADYKEQGAWISSASVTIHTGPQKFASYV